MNSLLRHFSLTASTCALGIAAALLFAAPSQAEETPIKVVFVGDSMSDGVGAAVQRHIGKDACLSKRIQISRHAEIGTGLARADRFKWPEKIAAMVSETNPDLVVASFGLNDRTGVVDPSNNVRVSFGASDWNARYSDQVVSFLKGASAAPAGTLWLGIPSLRDKVAHEDGIAKNALYRSVIEAHGNDKAAFVEPWRATTDGEETFQGYWVDPTGAKVQIRAQDGIHFTGIGYDQVAAYLSPKIVSHLEDKLGASRLRCEG